MRAHVVFAAGLVACSSADLVSSNPSGLRITGFSGDPTFGFEQSETGTSVQTLGCSPPPCTPPAPIVDVTYNDLTNESSLVQYPPGDRKIYAGASQMGYSVSVNGGTSFQYQPVAKLVPPNTGNPGGWDVLWGDPAITSSRSDQHFVYIQNLAVSHASFPATTQTDKRTGLPGLGYIEGSIEWNINSGQCPSGQECSYIDGGCIARSTDYGVHFNPVTPQDCVSNGGHFYDGGSMESDLSYGVYASWNDVTASTIDVWHASSLTGTFSLLPQPFAGRQIISHPRLRFDSATGRLYIIALSTPTGTTQRGQIVGNLLIDFWNGSTWHGPVVLNNMTLDNPTVLRGTVSGAAANVRTGAQFSFDVGTASVNNNDAIRVVFTAEHNALDKLFVDICTRDLVCTNTGTSWSTISYPGEQYSPVVMAQPGFIGVPPVWKVSYNSTEYDVSSPATTVAFMHDTLGVNPNNGLLIPWVGWPLQHTMPLCPDTRLDPNTGQVAGYWGDYDDLQILSVDSKGVSTFIRTHTDSANGQCTRDTYTSSPVNVSSHTCN